MTITQTIEVPADRRVFFEFLAPREIPAGKTRVDVILTPVVEKPRDQRSPDRGSETAPESAGESDTPHTDALFALFAPIRGTVDIDEIRTERIMSKHFK